MTGRWIIVDRLAAGTRTMGSQLGGWLVVRELVGRKRVKVMAQRTGGGFIAAWFVGGILYALGVLMWALAIGWAAGALYTSRDYAPGAPKPSPVPAAPAGPDDRERAGLLAVLAEILADRSGIHLRNLREQMRD